MPQLLFQDRTAATLELLIVHDNKPINSSCTPSQAFRAFELILHFYRMWDCNLCK